MQILFGQFKGRRLQAPKDRTIRPTTSRMRDWLVNVLRDRYEDARVLDLFAGSGSLGLEALSLGAREATFVDRGQQAMTLLRANLRNLGVQDRAQVLKDDVLRFLRPGRAPGPYDLVFVDPPYEEFDFPLLMTALARADILHEGGCLSIEHPSSIKDPRVGRGGRAPEANSGGKGEEGVALRFVRQKVFGRSTISLFANDEQDHRS